MEDPWDMAENMLSDVLVSNVYNEFFKDNSDMFKDKIVMDVGCRSGLLSLLAVEAGAVKVFAVGNMRSAGYVTNALGDGEKAEIFEPLNGCINKIRLPCGLKKVDIIVSEWMGHALFADSLFGQMLEARDKWLAKGGHIFPNVANLYINGIALPARQAMDKNLPPVLLTDEYVNQQSVITEKSLLKTINLTTSKYDGSFTVNFKMMALRKGKVSGCMLYFDIGFINAKGQLQKLFATGPDTPKTYMKQTLLSLEEDALDVAGQELLVGRFSMTLGYCAPRGVEFSLGLRIHK